MKIFFFLFPLALGKRMCYNSHRTYRQVLPWIVLPWIQKHQEFSSSGHPQEVMLLPHPWPSLFILFLGNLDRFLTYLVTSSVGTYDNDLKSTRAGNFHLSQTFKFSWKSNEPSRSSYICEGSKNPLLKTGSRLSFWQ